jgi:hypothetical protein
MTSFEIIEQVSRSSDYKKVLNNIYSGPHQDDLWQEVMLALLGQPAEKIEGLYQRNELKWFVVKIMMNMGRSKTSPFYLQIRSFGKNSVQLIAAEIEKTEPTYTQTPTEVPVYEKYEKEIEYHNQWVHTYTYLNKEQDFYPKKLIEMHYKDGLSVRAIQKKTTIPYRSIAHTLKLYKEQIRDSYQCKKRLK